MDSSAQLKQRRLWYETLDMGELWKSIHYIVLCRPGRREKEKKTTAENDISSLTLHYNVHGDINKLITCSVLLDLKRDCDSLYIYQDQALLFYEFCPHNSDVQQPESNILPANVLTYIQWMVLHYESCIMAHCATAVGGCGIWSFWSFSTWALKKPLGSFQVMLACH